MITTIIMALTLAVWCVTCILIANTQTKILRKQFEINDYLESIEREQRFIKSILYNFFSKINIVDAQSKETAEATTEKL